MTPFAGQEKQDISSWDFSGSLTDKACVATRSQIAISLNVASDRHQLGFNWQRCVVTVGILIIDPCPIQPLCLFPHLGNLPLQCQLDI